MKNCRAYCCQWLAIGQSSSHLPISTTYVIQLEQVTSVKATYITSRRSENDSVSTSKIKVVHTHTNFRKRFQDGWELDKNGLLLFFGYLLHHLKIITVGAFWQALTFAPLLLLAYFSRQRFLIHPRQSCKGNNNGTFHHWSIVFSRNRKSMRLSNGSRK